MTWLLLVPVVVAVGFLAGLILAGVYHGRFDHRSRVWQEPPVTVRCSCGQTTEHEQWCPAVPQLVTTRRDQPL